VGANSQGGARPDGVRVRPIRGLVQPSPPTYQCRRRVRVEHANFPTAALRAHSRLVVRGYPRVALGGERRPCVTWRWIGRDAASPPVCQPVCPPEYRAHLREHEPSC
jgi:hypothetical protein